MNVIIIVKNKNLNNCFCIIHVIKKYYTLVRERLGIHETRNIGKYLGFPIVHKVLVGINIIISFASWTILINSVTSAIPNHEMQWAALPAHV